jgi:hypothetical protein
MKVLMGKLTETENLAVQPAVFDYSTAGAGFCPPEQVPQKEYGPSMLRLTGKLSVGLLVSTALLSAKPATTSEHLSGNVPAAEITPSPHHVEHKPHRPSHLTRTKAVGAVVVHKAATHKQPKITAHLASISSTSSTKQYRYRSAHKAQQVPNYAIPISQAVEAQAVQNDQSSQWIEVDNAPYGYYLGDYNTATDKAIVLATTKQGDYNYLAIKMKRGSSTIEMCGWANYNTVTTGQAENKVKPVKDTSAYPDCIKQINRLSLFQFSFGHDYNSLNSSDGALTAQTPECDGIEYRNDRALDAATTGASLRNIRRIKHPLFDVKAKIDHTSPLFARYKPRDNKAVVARTEQAGWGVLDGRCITVIPKSGPPNRDRQRKKSLAG